MLYFKKFRKKNLLILFSLFVFIYFSNIVFANALGIELSQSYNAGETLTAKLNANFTNSLSSGNVFFYRGHVLINVIYDAVLIGNTFYIYAITPDTAREYKVIVKNVRYIENGLVKQADFSKNFSVSSEKADFYANPGFILSQEGNAFSIRLTNKRNNYTNIDLNFQGAGQTISLSPLGYKVISLSAQDIGDFTILPLSLKSEKTEYSLPIFVYPSSQAAGAGTGNTSANETYANASTGTGNASANYTNASETNMSSNVSQESNATGNASQEEYEPQQALKFSPESITELSLIKEQLPFTFTLSLMNLHTETISDISFSYSKELEGIISLFPIFIESIEPASSQNIGMEISSIEDEGFFNGTILAESASGNFSALFYLELNVTKDTLSIPSDIPVAEECNEDEIACAPGEYCENGTSSSYLASGSICCLGGVCSANLLEDRQQASGSSKILGFSILAVVIIIALLLFLRFKNAKKKGISDIYKKAEEKYMKEPKTG